jgi:molecular chaperone DnaK (HSP70)
VKHRETMIKKSETDELIDLLSESFKLLGDMIPKEYKKEGDAAIAEAMTQLHSKKIRKAVRAKIKREPAITKLEAAILKKALEEVRVS